MPGFLNANHSLRIRRAADQKTGAGLLIARGRLALFLNAVALLTVATRAWPSLALADPSVPRYFYTVREGESISRLLDRMGIAPVYGRKGGLRKVLVLNPSKRSTQGNSIFPGEILVLPIEDESQLEGRARVLPSGEVLLDREAAAATPIAAEADTSKPDTAKKSTSNRAPAGYFSEPSPDGLEVPDAERKDSSGPPVSAHDDSSSDQSLFFVPQLVYTGISARDKANGGVLRATDGNYGFRVGYAQKWSDHFTLYAVVNWYRIELQSPLSSGRTTTEKSYSGFAVGTKHQLSDAWALGTSLGYQQEPIVSAVNLTDLVIDRIGLPEAGLSVSKRLAESTNRHFTLLGEFGGSLTLPTKAQNFNASLGYIAFGKLVARSSLGAKTKLELGPYYRIQSLNTDLIRQTLTSLGLTVQLQWLFGGDKTQLIRGSVSEKMQISMTSPAR